MSYQEIADRVTRLPVRERLALLELISRSLRDDVAPAPGLPPEVAADILERVARRLGQPIPADASLRRTLGLAATSAAAPSDEDVREILADELVRKHA